MYVKADRDAPQECVHREFHNIRELLEILMSEHTPTKHKIRMEAGFGWTPPTDVFETETEVVIMVDIAGMNRRDISVMTDGSILTIQGVRAEVAPPGKKQFHKMEIQVGPFQRLIQVPVPVDSGYVFTNYSNGLLEIRLKKKFDDEDKKRIEVK
jgi:HSP20 family molecular chaperone IbpA